MVGIWRTSRLYFQCIWYTLLTHLVCSSVVTPVPVRSSFRVKVLSFAVFPGPSKSHRPAIHQANAKVEHFWHLYLFTPITPLFQSDLDCPKNTLVASVSECLCKSCVPLRHCVGGRLHFTICRPFGPSLRGTHIWGRLLKDQQSTNSHTHTLWVVGKRAG